MVIETAAEGPPSSLAADVAHVLEGYRATKRQLDSVTDVVERTIGYAALQGQARETARFLNTTASGVRPADLVHLTSFADDLTIARAARGPAAFGLDAAKSAFTASPLTLGPAALLVIGVIAGKLVDLGGAAAPLILGGGGATILFILFFAMRGAFGQLSRLWTRARTIGSEFESAYAAHAVPAEARLAAVSAGRPPSSSRFVPIVRLYAMAGVAALWVFILVCGAVFAFGALTAMSDIITQGVNDSLKFP